MALGMVRPRAIESERRMMFVLSQQEFVFTKSYAKPFVCRGATSYPRLASVASVASVENWNLFLVKKMFLFLSY